MRTTPRTRRASIEAVAKTAITERVYSLNVSRTTAGMDLIPHARMLSQSLGVWRNEIPEDAAIATPATLSHAKPGTASDG